MNIVFASNYSISDDNQIKEKTCTPGPSEEINVNNPFSTSPFIAAFPPKIPVLPFCNVACK